MGKTPSGRERLSIHKLPSALGRWEDIAALIARKRVAVFLDYDGTLTPIVARPELAVLADDMREIVRCLSELCLVAVVSGRDRIDVQNMVQIETLFYAGSHGFDIAGPEGMHIQYEHGGDFLTSLDRVERELEKMLSGIEGMLIERKKYSIAVHVRGVAAEYEAQVEDVVDAALARALDLRKGLGKKVFEIQPRIEWHKGKAVLWLLEVLKLEGTDVVPVYIGDDVTDEDAFRALSDQTDHAHYARHGIGGIGIIVSETPRPTAARYSLKNTDEVQTFLRKLSVALESQLAKDVQ